MIRRIGAPAPSVGVHGDRFDAADRPLEERELTALWLLGRVPASVLPWPLVRAGRAGRGAGPDVREATFALPSGVTATGDVEVHLRATDFVRHGHADDAAYAGVRLHLVWEDDRAPDLRATPTALPGGGYAPTAEVGPALAGDVAALRARLRRGPSGGEPCAACAPERAQHVLRAEGGRRLAERSWRAAQLAAELGWEGAWRFLLDRTLRASAGRRREDARERTQLAAEITAGLGGAALSRLAELALSERPSVLVEALRGGDPRTSSARGPAIGRSRAAEVGWNAALPLLIALAAAYQGTTLARATSRLVERWPAPRPYGRTRALAALLAVDRPERALVSQGLLHLQELWCERGGCGACPCSPGADVQPDAGLRASARER